jgi:cytoskeletal protein RodZ
MAPQAAATQQKEITPQDMTVGEILRRSRLHYNQSLEDIERALRIKASQIGAIEDGRYDLLPGRVYVIGFIRSYAEYLGLDGEKMIGLYKNQSGGKTAKPEFHFPVAASDSKIPNPWLVGGSLVTALLVIVLWISVSSHDRSAVTTIPDAPSKTADIAGPPVPKDLNKNLNAKPAAVAATTPAPNTAQTASSTEKQQEGGIILNIVKNSWVEIKDKDGKSVVSRVLKEGDKYFVPDRPDLSISLGNSAGVQLEIEGKTVQKLGEEGQVLRNLPLDVKFLKQKYAKDFANPAR